MWQQLHLNCKTCSTQIYIVGWLVNRKKERKKEYLFIFLRHLQAQSHLKTAGDLLFLNRHVLSRTFFFRDDVAHSLHIALAHCSLRIVLAHLSSTGTSLFAHHSSTSLLSRHTSLLWAVLNFSSGTSDPADTAYWSKWYSSDFFHKGCGNVKRSLQTDFQAPGDFSYRQDHGWACSGVCKVTWIRERPIHF